MEAKKEAKAEGDKGAKRSPVHRSPNYPAFTLGEAINKVRILWEKDHKVGAHKDVVLQHLGYSTESGTALRTLATVKSFGLTTEKDGRILVSDKALDILLYPKNDARHIEGLRESALNPSIYNELYGEYRGVFPSDESLKSELLRSYSFNPKQVDSFLADFRETLKYAGLDRPLSDEHSGGDEDRMNREAPPAITGTVHQRQAPQSVAGAATVRQIAYSLPLKKQNEATLSFKKTPEKGDLVLIKSWLELMEENLTEQPVDNAQDLM